LFFQASLPGGAELIIVCRGDVRRWWREWAGSMNT
jgi:hypothetical protein